MCECSGLRPRTAGSIIAFEGRDLFMAYFPLFVDLSGQDCLLVGGGTVACRKAEKLLSYGPRLTVIAQEITPALAALPGLALCRRAFAPADIAGRRLVIAATSDRALNRAISAQCQAAGIPVNVVDDPQACTFLFPALVQRGALSVGISTGGASPSAAIWLKEQISAALPERLDDILRWLEACRPAIKAACPAEAARAKVFHALFAAALAADRPLNAAEYEQILAQEVLP